MLALMHSLSSWICQILLYQVPLPNNHHIIVMATNNHGYRAGHPISQQCNMSLINTDTMVTHRVYNLLYDCSPIVYPVDCWLP